MVFLPPRHGKSFTTSIMFPAWFLSRNPNRQVIITGHTEDLALDFSKDAKRQIIEGVEIFSRVRIDHESRGAGHWKLANARGGCIAAGIGGPITGRGADVALVDDPFKTYEEAHSETIREKIWNWYRSVLRTRLMPGGSIIIINTRWHEDDLCGRLLAGQDKDDLLPWEVLSFPAIAEQDEPTIGRKIGEPLSPQRYPMPELLEIKKNLGPYLWNALYQQRPRPEEGDYFNQRWILRAQQSWVPERMLCYSAMDLAIGTNDTNDWSVIVTAGVKDNEVFPLDVRRFRGDAYEIGRQLIDVQRTFNPVNIGVEDGLIRRMIWPSVSQEMRRQNVFINPIWLHPVSDKQARARSLQARMRNGTVYFPHEHATPWVDDLTEELLSFPSGKWDDQVDALAWLAIMLDQAPDPQTGINVDAIAR